MFLKPYYRYLKEKIEDDIENLGKDISNDSTKDTTTKETKHKEDSTTTDSTEEVDTTNAPEETPSTDTEETTDDTNTDSLDTPPEETADPTEELELNKEILGVFDSFNDTRDKIKNIVANIDQIFFYIEKTETKIDLLKLKDLYTKVDTAIKIIIKKNITKDNIDLVKKQYTDITSINNNLISELEKIVNNIKTVI